MSITASPSRNGVDTATLFATLDAVKGQPEIAKFRFRAENTWQSGTHSRSRISGYFGALQDMEHKQVTELDADHPPVLVGNDNGPTPVEYLLHALAACLTAGIANIAAARGVDLTRVSSTVEGDIDLLGILGLSDGSVRNGYQGVKVVFHIDGDADEETLRGIVEQSRRRSAVYDVLTNPTPVSVDVVVGRGRPVAPSHHPPSPHARPAHPGRPGRRTWRNPSCPPSTRSSSAPATPGSPSAGC
jgi:uncharacterized OsmC-like protein